MILTTAKSGNDIVHISDYDVTLKGKVKCRTCGDDLIAKRGSIKAHHFAHRCLNCDPWVSGPMTEWHKAWQFLCQPQYTEVRMDDPDGTFHIADIKTPEGLVIEIQHSHLKNGWEREKFYGRMLWIVDGNECLVYLKGTNFLLIKGPAFWESLSVLFIDFAGGLYRQISRCNTMMLALLIDKLTFIRSAFGDALKPDWHNLVPKCTDVPTSSLILSFYQESGDVPCMCMQGPTYQHRDVLRRAGFTWNPLQKDWSSLAPAITLSEISATDWLTQFNCVLCQGTDDDKYVYVEDWELSFLQYDTSGQEKPTCFFCQLCRKDVVWVADDSFTRVLFTDGEIISANTPTSVA